MKALTALFTALALLLGVVACDTSPAPAPITTPASVELVEPTLPTPAPAPVPDTVTAPDVQLTAERIVIQTAPAPALEAPTGPTVDTTHAPLTLEFVTAYPIYYSASATCPIGTAMAMDDTCLPLHYWANPVA